MLSNGIINQLIGIDESFKAPTKLMNILKNNDIKDDFFNSFLELESNLNYDWFTNYFQEEHSDRKGKKQDFTPDGIVKLLSSLLGEFETNADICAGTGGLTIKRWTENKLGKFYCEEYSDRAMPFLLFNLMIRNANAYVFHGDSLSRDCKHLYKIIPSNDENGFGTLKEVTDAVPIVDADTVIMNPPYSLKWNPDDKMLKEPRFNIIDVLPPKSKADYAFIMQGLSNLKEDGKMAVILPHGVLFRGAREEKIRRKLIEFNWLDAVIGLPEKAFLNTSIPTVVLILKKHRDTKDVLFIDASKEFTKNKAYNVVEDKHIKKIIGVYEGRFEAKRFSNIVSFDELKDNDFNLNIPRYVDTFVPEPVKPLHEIVDEMRKLDEETEQNAKELGKMLQGLVGTNPESDREIKAFTEYWCGKYGVPIEDNELKQDEEQDKGEQLSLL